MRDFPRWRSLPFLVLPGAAQMALDLLLAGRAASTGEPCFRAYGWARPTVTLGRFQRLAPDEAAAVRAAGHDLVRRPTGGRAVLHADELTYAAYLPHGPRDSRREVFAWIADRLVAALAAVGVAAHLAEPARAPAGGAAPHPGGVAAHPDGAAARPAGRAANCFAALSEWEVADAAGRKLVGSAQAFVAGALLQHGSLPVSARFLELDTLLGGAGAAGKAAWLDVPVPALAAALGAAWRGAVDVAPLAAEEVAALVEEAARLAPAHAVGG